MPYRYTFSIVFVGLPRATTLPAGPLPQPLTYHTNAATAGPHPLPPPTGMGRPGVDAGRRALFPGPVPLPDLQWATNLSRFDQCPGPLMRTGEDIGLTHCDPHASSGRCSSYGQPLLGKATKRLLTMHMLAGLDSL